MVEGPDWATPFLPRLCLRFTELTKDWVCGQPCLETGIDWGDRLVGKKLGQKRFFFPETNLDYSLLDWVRG